MSGSQDGALRRVRIEWTGPFSRADVLKMRGKNDYGLYLIEGHYALHGCRGALYLGKACQQTYGVRIGQHWFWLEY